MNDWGKRRSLIIFKKSIMIKVLDKYLLIGHLLHDSCRKLVTVPFTEEIEKSTVIHICLWFLVAPQK